MESLPRALFRRDGAWLRFSGYRQTIEAMTADQVGPALESAQRAADAGRWVAGFVSYEAAAAFDLSCHRPLAHLPLVRFDVYDSVENDGGRRTDNSIDSAEELSVELYSPLLSPESYSRAFEILRRHLYEGNSYQVNFTFPLRAGPGAANAPETPDGPGEPGDPERCEALFARLVGENPPPYAAFLDTGRHAVLSLSPELFFDLADGVISSKPMKGTARRSGVEEVDTAAVAYLQTSPKERAENLMIVDMIRNDLGRIATVGSVSVPRLFEIETYPTVFQMTSTVTARTGASVPRIMAALFPCASVTGAPKVRTMEIIRELEAEPRGVYCGALGYLGPGRLARFSVAIRTLLVDRVSGEYRYGVGSGVTWDSTAHGEYEECLVKAAALGRRQPEFALLESVLHHPALGLFLLDLHLDRMGASARALGFPFDRDRARLALTRAAGEHPGPAKLRLLLGHDGMPTVEVQPLGADPLTSDPLGPPVRIRAAICPFVVRSDDPALRHKTTRRELYDRARGTAPDSDEVILVNEEGRPTEGTASNLVIRRGDGRLVTPPVSEGLLPGTFRRYLVDAGLVEEAVIALEELRAAGEIYLVNSVRLWRRVSMVG